MSFEAVIGLEIHAQLLTRTKMFCACPNRFGAEPNTLVCPVCLGHPGALPVANERAVALALRMGPALGARINPRSEWARKNYFYPDLPKGYQITQYEHPLIEGGRLTIANGRTIPIARMHLEEDAGKLVHRAGESLVDLNRCGTPLLEIVTEPELRSAADARALLIELRRLLQYCEVSDGDLEKGNFRCDANLSIRAPGDASLSAKTEIKNLNSFRHVEQALAHEFARQGRLRARGESVAPATLLWDPGRGETRQMRSKEAAPDYRYFPEPDLPPLELAETWIASIARELPELPAARRARFAADYGLRPDEARNLTATRPRADFFEAVLAAGAGDSRRAANLITAIAAIEETKVAPESLAELVRTEVGANLAKRILKEMVASGASAGQIMSERNWIATTDEGHLATWATEVLDAHPAEVTAYVGGKAALLEFFVGGVMRRSQGRADPEAARQMLVAILKRRTTGRPSES